MLSKGVKPPESRFEITKTGIERRPKRGMVVATVESMTPRAVTAKRWIPAPNANRRREPAIGTPSTPRTTACKDK